MDQNHEGLRLPLISAASDGPLYRQIVNAIKCEISDGHLTPGQSLPSFRALAEELLVSLITVKRAYEELEHEGIIYRKQGLGTFVSEDGLSRTRDVKRQRASELMEQAAREAAEAGMSKSEILNLAERLIRAPQGEESQR